MTRKMRISEINDPTPDSAMAGPRKQPVQQTASSGCPLRHGCGVKLAGGNATHFVLQITPADLAVEAQVQANASLRVVAVKLRPPALTTTAPAVPASVTATATLSEGRAPTTRHSAETPLSKRELYRVATNGNDWHEDRVEVQFVAASCQRAGISRQVGNLPPQTVVGGPPSREPHALKTRTKACKRMTLELPRLRVNPPKFDPHALDF